MAVSGQAEDVQVAHEAQREHTGAGGGCCQVGKSASDFLEQLVTSGFPIDLTCEKRQLSDYGTLEPL